MKHVVNYVLGDDPLSDRQLMLGPLELEVMAVLWNFGASNVRDVVGQMQRELAYTTVMTTLDRLYKKGLLGREMTERAFVYAPKLTREEWNRRRAGEMMAGFLSGPEESRHLLLSCLVDAVGSHDLQLLDELENKIQRKREELANSKQK
ncbi:MAG TPA: BlaI/MecI/CopY family transcriptional regulator [Candidatus Binatia bacterium]|nr:BlaI/MecI/CopY family transcriptional regulator [Candidatus Binatia bacterium]